MEFKSQICTTKEQSERLLKMGLKKETADMGLAGDIPIAIEDWKTQDTTLIDFPAWSLHRLIEISDQRAISPFSQIENLYDELIAIIQSYIHLGYIKKEYLDMDIVNANEEENMELLKNGGK